MPYAFRALLLFAALARAQDPAFDKIPFDDWVAHPAAQTQFKWSVRITAGRLTSFQRMMARVDILVDGTEIVKRKGRGELTFFVQLTPVQLTSSDHRKFQAHGAYDLKKATEAIAKSRIVSSQTAFVVAGDYRVDVAIQDSQTGEHATIERSLHVNAVGSDPLPNADRMLPPVEFHTAANAPDVWFQPDSTGVLNLPVEMRHPIRVELLANVSPSTIGPRLRPGRMTTRNLGDILPEWKTFDQLNLSQGSLRASLIDITRQQVLFTQERQGAPSPIDWPRLRRSILEANPQTIDVRELAKRRSSPQFFVDEVRKRVKPQTALIILTGVMGFAGNDDRRPIEIDPREAGKVYYVRFHFIRMRIPPVSDTLEEPRRKSVLPQSEELEAFDTLYDMVKPLQPRLFDVYSAGGARKALAAIMKDLERL